ncbi:IS5 family transposase [Burkholderia ubonensis]|uniref:Transposase n=1 Tax=Burkholderia ubonensis TaxID=101571 RepID=A0AAW3N9U7_9BURK|nr:IS5 family transposase [Burkholderia ubonensis]KVT49594.1 transposase [Burkholderia ubonensis]
MKQTDLNLDLTNRRTRKRTFLDEMERAVPWKEFVELIAPHAPTKATERRPFPIEAMLRIHFLRQWFGLSDVAMEETLYDVPLYREFAGLGGMTRLPDRVSILRFRHLLEQHQLAAQFLKTVNAQLSANGYLPKEGTAVDATLIAAPSSTKNKDGKRDPEMHQTKKGNAWHFGMKCHIGIDAVTHARALVHGDEAEVFADAGYQGVDKREETQDIKVQWHIAMRLSKRRPLNKDTALGELLEQCEKLKARIRAKVEHPFRVIKRQFGHAKVRYRGLMKNTQQLHTLFALSNLWMAHR